MDNVLIDGSWLRKKLAEVSAKIERFEKMQKEGKDFSGNDKFSYKELEKMKIEQSLLKEIFAHEIDPN